MAELTLVALGGNALVREGQRGTLEEQAANLDRSLAVVVRLAQRGHDVIITHGNGPQVGHILLRAEVARGRAYDLPLDVCVAQSQGEMGYLIAQRLQHALGGAGLLRPVAAIVTRVVVDRDDPRMAEPSKPVGPFLTPEEAEALRQQGMHVAVDAHRGWRRVVPSPWPRRIVELDTVRQAVEGGAIVIAAGGGGIPVRETEDGRLEGVEAVIDKDLSGVVLAAGLGAGRVLDLTAVERVKLWFGTPEERDIRRMAASEVRRYLAAGHFAPGSMGPKVEAAVWFLEHGGREFVVSTPEQAVAASEGDAGTHLIPG